MDLALYVGVSVQAYTKNITNAEGKATCHLPHESPKMCRKVRSDFFSTLLCKLLLSLLFCSYICLLLHLINQLSLVEHFVALQSKNIFFRINDRMEKF
jgi:hypothetical protein